MKELVAAEIAKRVRDGEILGVGTGSTVELAIDKIGRRVNEEGLSISAVPSSFQTAWRCEKAGIKVLHAGWRKELAWGFDGADAVDGKLWVIKGGGGAMLLEKLLAARCRELIIIVDESKMKTSLDGLAIPVEVIPEGAWAAERGFEQLGAETAALRMAGAGKHGPVITEKGNLIYDVRFPKVDAGLEERIKTVVGVVDSGLFTRYVSEVWAASKSGVKKLRRPAG